MLIGDTTDSTCLGLRQRQCLAKNTSFSHLRFEHFLEKDLLHGEFKRRLCFIPFYPTLLFLDLQLDQKVPLCEFERINRVLFAVLNRLESERSLNLVFVIHFESLFFLA